ncbi:TPA: helix-turn-helix domain-containing protein [Salmonella enterica subsp. diarizonae serovar 50:k:z]|nr:helix-turn-helix transcriptional regulator [Salmonella enterica]
MSIPQNEKLKLLRESERLKMKEMSDLIGINYYTYHGYESGKSKMPLDFGILLLRNPRFRKYRDWFMFDETEPKAGQVVPALAHIGQEDSEFSHYGSNTGE